MNSDRKLKIELPKTVNTKEVTPGKLYNIKTFGDDESHVYGIARILQTRINNPCIAVLFNDGSVGYRYISELIWLNQVVQ